MSLFQGVRHERSSPDRFGSRYEAEDRAWQGAVLKTYHHVTKIQKPEAFRTWPFRTVRNFCLMKRRKKVDEPSHVMSLDGTMDATDAGRRPDEVALNKWLGVRLRAALAGLAPVDRMIVLLREMEGLSTR